MKNFEKPEPPSVGRVQRDKKKKQERHKLLIKRKEWYEKELQVTKEELAIQEGEK